MLLSILHKPVINTFFKYFFSFIWLYDHGFADNHGNRMIDKPKRFVEDKLYATPIILIGTTGRSTFFAITANPPKNGCTLPSVKRPPSGKIIRSHGCFFTISIACTRVRNPFERGLSYQPTLQCVAQ